MTVAAPDTDPGPQLTTITLDTLATIAAQLAPVLAAGNASPASHVLDPRTTQRAEDIFRQHGVTFTGPHPA